MKYLPKALCLALAMALMLSILPITVFAASGTLSGDFRYTVLEDGTAEITGYVGKDADVTVPSVIDGYTVTSIGEEAFCEKNTLVSITVPGSVTRLGQWAFSYNDNLETVVLPDTITEMGQGMFDYDRKLKSVNLPSGLTLIPRKTFLDCESLEEVAIPDGVTVIGDEAFCNCQSVTSFTLPSGLESIGEDAFSDCKALAGITLPSSLKSVGEHGFFNCTGFHSVLIPVSVESIGRYAFGYRLGDYNAITKRSDFTIKGWADTAAAQYASDNGLPFTELAAYGTPVTVTFDKNGGKGEMEPLTVLVGDTIVIPACEFTREDCEFTQWQVGFSETYQPGDPLTVTEDTKLYVQWKLSGVHDETYLDRATDASTTQVIGTLQLTDTRTGKVYTETIDGDAFASTFSDPYGGDTTVIDNMTEALYTAAEAYTDRDQLTLTKDVDAAPVIMDTWDQRRFEYLTVTRSTGEEGNIFVISGDYGHQWQVDVTMEAQFESPEVVYLCTGTTEGGTYMMEDTFHREPMDYSMNMAQEYGATVTLTAAPAEGYTFKGWYEGIRGDKDSGHWGMVYDHTDVCYSADSTYSFPIYKNTSICAVFEEAASDRLSGTVTSFLDDCVPVTLTLSADGSVVKETVLTGCDSTYGFGAVADGAYTLTVSKKNHVTRTYDITVSGATQQDVKICPLGDISGDGKITTKDYAMANAHAMKKTILTGYPLACGDVLKQDGKVTTADAARINAAAMKISPLW